MTLFHRFLFLSIIIYLSSISLPAQEYIPSQASTPWNNKERVIRYQPDGRDFVIINGERRFNRALYGTNTGYRVEGGDLPEFAQYMPDMGGNLKFGIIVEEKSKWLIESDTIVARYRPGSMLYTIKDKLFGKGQLNIQLLAMADAEGFIVKIESQNIPSNVQLFWAFGGISGKRFSRGGDIGFDPESSFYLLPEYCVDNIYKLKDGAFTTYYIPRKIKSKLDIEQWRTKTEEEKLEVMKPVSGIYPPQSRINISDAEYQSSPLDFSDSGAGDHPAITGTLLLDQPNAIYFSLYMPESIGAVNYKILDEMFNKAEEVRKELAGRIEVNTPDKYINTLGGALSVAADAIYQEPSYLHGAIAWRMWLNGWRGASCADALGWHDRAKAHFSGYIQSQVTEPASGPVVPDTSRHFARQKEVMGTSMFSSGYICREPNGKFRPHHYDMNLVFIDQLLTHYLNTGDIDYIKETWPAIKLHLAWEKRNFDGDDDGLYDAYCCIWASDAVEYNGGKVSYSSAYNYRANKMAAKIAQLAGEDPKPYREEADKILKALKGQLWLPHLGRYAEYRDVFGEGKTHDMPGIWTIYHTLDEGVADPFQAYQSTRYIDEEIPHIPVIAKGLEEGYYTISTTNWHPYTWSVNNVALAEVMHTSLAYWQASRSQDAYLLWKSALLESMYLGASPGNFQQISYYDAMRGELYRDFADPIGMVSRTLIEGLFGIKPNALTDTLTIQPGFPQEWDHASIKTPDITINYKREENSDKYTIHQSFPTQMNLKLKVNACKEKVNFVKVNGKKVSWQVVDNAVGVPQMQICVDKSVNYTIEIVWEGKDIKRMEKSFVTVNTGTISLNPPYTEFVDYYDPQGVFSNVSISGSSASGTFDSISGFHTVFIKVKQGGFTWWMPFDLELTEPVEINVVDENQENGIAVKIKNNEENSYHRGEIYINNVRVSGSEIRIGSKKESDAIYIPFKYLVHGSNSIKFSGNGVTAEEVFIDWDLPLSKECNFDLVDISELYNDKITQIFQHKYLSPRSEYPTLQTPWQGIGNWCYPWINPEINDSGLRNIAGSDDKIELPQGIPFTTPSDTNKTNVMFVSQWDNFPSEIVVPLSGKSSHAYLMMTGTTNPMQSRFTNGEVVFTYTDGSQDVLELKNPEIWWPIEQDYYTDGYAFNIDYPKPWRVHLKTGLITRGFDDYSKIKGFSNYAIDGGAATILDMPLNADKTLKSVTVKAVANEVIIGLMSLTLVR